ncbi:MAG: Long-chain-fatty-acid--CoA ligase FadD13 [Smithella sp. PtaU1.Bin162]|nr:MAG: Long-chain-fatty-acid--CoA ligase FadD13 [Smithella sp. PtaU1.Bin162]
MQMQPEGIGSWFKYREMETPDKEALVSDEKRFSYRELNQRINRLSWAMQSLGIKHGDRIAVLSYNCNEFAEIIIAAAKLGLILVPLNWRLTPVELTFILSDSGAATLFYDASFTATAEELQKKTGVKNLISLYGESSLKGSRTYDDLTAGTPDTEPTPSAPVGLDTPHIIMYTAGTTGKPKGAVLTQGASFWNAVNCISAISITADDRDLNVLPMFHIGGIGLFTLAVFYMGGTVLLLRTFDPAKALTKIRQEKVSIFFGVPAIFLFLANQPDFQCLKDVRVVMCGGAPLPVSLIKLYDEKGLRLLQGFGMSEAAPSIAILDKDMYLQKAGSIGRRLMHLETRVVDEDMKDVPAGEVGELILRGPNVMIGYWNRPEATEEAFRGGWFHSGDLARREADGSLYIVDRSKDMYISGGENVYPAEVENALYEIPEIGEAAVIGIPDHKWGEVGKAIIAVKQGKKLTEEQVISYLKGRLAKFKVPASVVFTDLLPRNAMGKVMKNTLREKYIMKNSEID